jgi:hypothetical protein
MVAGMSDPTTPEEARAQLRRLGIPDQNLSDEQALKLLGDLIRAQVPAPPIPARTPPVNGRAWLAAALTAGGWAVPEDRQQTADLGDGRDPVPLAALAFLVMRHLPNARPPQPWTDEHLSAETKLPIDDLRRSQTLLDQVAEDVGRPNKLGARWWEPS